LNINGAAITGQVRGQPITGTIESGNIEATVRFGSQMTINLRGHVRGRRIKGTATIVEQKLTLDWSARQEPQRMSAPRIHIFEPSRFHHFFRSDVAPVLRVRPGDTVETWSLDACGSDSRGVRRTIGGNPLTGPFFIEGAVPGDTLEIRLTRLKLNRDTAISSSVMTNKAIDPSYIEQRGRLADKDIAWRLDRENGFAFLDKPTKLLKSCRVKLAPMLGCVGVAPSDGMKLGSVHLGEFGGNLDYRDLGEGVTVYLPVFVPGAFLFVGDGHAAQGDGELLSNGLETSMAITFRVGLKRDAGPASPRLENSSHFMASGIGGSLEEALRRATTNLSRWLEKIYGFDPIEVSCVLGTSMTYDIAEIVNPSFHVVAKVSKTDLAAMTGDPVKSHGPGDRAVPPRFPANS